MALRRSNPQRLRAQTFQRDQGVCAGCGLDCGALEDFLLGAWDWIGSQVEGEIEDRGKWKAIGNVRMALLRAAAEMPMQGPLWIADHIVPFEMGGADNLSNIQTLCWTCNKPKTREDIRMIRKSQRIQAKGPRKHLGYVG